MSRFELIERGCLKKKLKVNYIVVASLQDLSMGKQVWDLQLSSSNVFKQRHETSELYGQSWSP